MTPATHAPDESTHTSSDSSAHRKASRGIGWTLFFALFSLALLSGGGFLLYKSGRVLWDHHRAKSWEVVPARVESVKLETHRGSGRNASTSYKVACRYRYVYEGQSYTGDRVGLIDDADNIGSWQQTQYQRLREAQRRRKPVDCYVNPDNPQEAVLSRELRFGLLCVSLVVGVVLGGGGIAMLVGGLRFNRNARETRTLQAAHPDKPWLQKPEWATGRITSQLGASELVLWFIAGVWNAISIPLAVLIVTDALPRRIYPALIGLLFPIVGAGLLVSAIRATARRRKYGRSVLELDTIPGVVGGYLRGRLRIVGRLDGIDEVTVTLKCVHRWRTGSGKNRHTRTETLWSETTQHPVSVTFGQTEVTVPVAFQIPYSCRPCDESDSDDSIIWRLEARAEAPGVGLAIDFQVPVFRTEASDERIGPSPERVQREMAVIHGDDNPLPDQIREGIGPGGEPELTISCWMGAGSVVLILLLLIAISGVATFAGYRVFAGDWFMILFLLVFGSIDLIMVAILLSCFGSYRLRFSPGRLVRQRSFGPVLRTLELTAGEVIQVEVNEDARSGDSKWFGVYCHIPHPPDQKLQQPRRVKVAGNIRDELAARWLAHRIGTHLGAPVATET